MTTSIVASDFVAELVANDAPSVDMMIGIGLVKETDAVYFQYMGQEQSPVALTLPSGKPCTRLPHVTLTGIEIADDIGEFKSTKLNLFLTSSAGRTVMLTSGLQTIWSQCIITGLMAVFNEYGLNAPLTIDTWKGTSKMRPCFAAIRQGTQKMSDSDLYEQLKEARTDRDRERVERIMRDSVDILRGALGIEQTSVSEVVAEAEETLEF